MGLGPSQSYKVEYNGYTLPGYCQNESFDSTAGIADHPAPYADGSLSEYTGLTNKLLSLRMKVWEQGFLATKNAIQEAAHSTVDGCIASEISVRCVSRNGYIGSCYSYPCWSPTTIS